MPSTTADGIARMPINLGAKGGAAVLSGGLRFALAIVAARWLGVADYGFYAFAFTLIFVFMQISDFGLPIYVCREIAREPGRAAVLVGHVLRRKLELSAIAACCAVASSLLFAKSSSERQVFWLLTVSILLTSLNNTINWIFRGFHRQVLEAKVVGVNAVVSAILGALALLMGWGARGLAAGLTVGSVLAFGLATRYLFGLLPLGLWVGHLKRPTVAVPWRGLIQLAVITQLPFVPHAFDLFVLEHFHGHTIIGYFSVATRLTGGALMVPLVVMSVVFPAFTSASATDPQTRRRLSQRTLLALLGAGGLVAGALIVGADLLLATVFGSEYLPAAPCLRIFGTTLVCLFPGLALRDLLVASGRQTAVAWVIIATGAAHMLTSALLVRDFAEMGPAWAALLDAGVTTLLFFYLFAGKRADARINQ